MEYLKQERRIKMFMAADWTCKVCGKPLQEGTPQLAHRIRQSKQNLKKYGEEIMHHNFNLVATCSLKCNGRVDITFNTLEHNKLIDRIKKDIEKKTQV